MLTLPARLIAGDTIDITARSDAYPASAGWALRVRLTPRAAGAQAIAVDTAAAGDAHRLLVAASTTAGWAAGAYGWAVWAERAGASVTLDSGQVEILPDPRQAAAGTDTRTQAERALADAKAALAAWTPTAKRWQIGDRQHEFASAAEVLQVVRYWQAQVRGERRAAAAAAGRPMPRRTTLRIGR